MPRVLVIEDEDSIREFVVHILQQAGYEVLQAANGREGVKLYRNEPFDLVITDLIMPEQDGIEIITSLRRDYPDVKIIAISGGGRIGTKSYLQMAKMMGAHRTLEKPFDANELLKAAQEVLEQQG